MQQPQSEKNNEDKNTKTPKQERNSFFSQKISDAFKNINQYYDKLPEEEKDFFSKIVRMGIGE